MELVVAVLDADFAFLRAFSDKQLPVGSAIDVTWSVEMVYRVVTGVDICAVLLVATIRT
jgi:hypothetical protein